MKNIIKEFKRTLTEMDFDGIHMDQYGFPKYAKSLKNPVIDFAKELPSLINDTIDSVQDIEKESQLNRDLNKDMGDDVESFAHGALGMDHPDKIEEETSSRATKAGL